MSTPAELLAAQQESAPSTAESSTYGSHFEAPETENTSVNDNASDNEGAIKNLEESTPSVLDENAFPILGSAPVKSAKTVWGPSNVSNGNGHAVSKPVLIRSLNVQESFTIDLDQQITITKGELFNIISSVKTQFKVSVESTLSQKSNKRTFLISGNAESVKKARREIIKKLTKPVVIEFTIPSKLRRNVIGPNGKNLTPIINATAAKIDIAKENSRASTPAIDEEESDDIFGSPVSVRIEGDAEGADMAKALILAIVNEHTKTISAKIEVDERLKPFIKAEIEESVSVPESVELSVPSKDDKSSKILLSGAREDVIELRDQIKSLLSQLESSIKTETRAVKKNFHSFIDPSVIYEESATVVTIPAKTDPSTEIIFTGTKENVKKALAITKKITDSYKVLALEISKAHGGNVAHAKHMAAYFAFSGFFESISNDSITVSAAPYSALADEELKTVQVDISCAGGTERSAAEAVKKQVIDKVNVTPPNSIKAVTDIDSFVFSQIDSSIVSVAKENNVTIIPFAKLAGSGNTLLLVANQVDDDFAPTAEEISQRIITVDEALNKLRELSENVSSEVIAVPKEEQKLIYGNNGSTLRTILSHYTKEGVEILLNQNREGASSDELLIRGFKQEVPAVIKEIKQVIHDVKNHEQAVKYNITIDYPVRLLSRLIGQKGAHLNTLREKFDVKIDVEDHADDAAEAKVKITGLKVNVDAASEEINSLGKKWADDKTLKLNIEQKYHGALVGKSGLYVKRLEEKYKVSINFPYRDSANANEVVIRGPSRGVAKAEEEIKELLKYEIENGFKSSVTIPVSAISKVLGKGGDTIKGISHETGVEFRFSRDDAKEKELGYTEVELTGTKAAVKAAESKINALIKISENRVTSKITVDPKYHRLIVGPGGSTMQEIIRKAGATDGDDRPSLQIPNHGSESEEIVCTGDKKVVASIIKQIEDLVAEKAKQITETLEVPKKKHRVLIGPNGSIRKNLESEYNVHIQIPKADSKSTNVTIEGTPENVTAAKAKITDLVKDNWLSEVLVPASVHSAIAERGSFFRRLRNEFNVSVEHGNDSRIATKLSASSIPQPPAEVYGGDDEKSKWTIIEDSNKSDEQKISWRLKGDDANVAKAEAAIKKLVEQSTKHTATGYFYSSKPEAFAKIVGPQGKRVQQLRERSGCFIVVPRIEDVVNNVIYVRGDKEGLEKVRNSFLTSLD